ncbi:MAG: cupin protein, partial [Thermoleophilia bacterium]|nr:cupin protein [Thermoleophilia bacterium]
VLNARDASWLRRDGGGHQLNLTGYHGEACDQAFPLLGVNLRVLEPGEPMAMYHAEADAEGFLVLAGSPLLIIEGVERALRQWDFVHCPPGAGHTIVGAGSGPSTILAMGSRVHMQEPCNGGGYIASEAAARHGASVSADTRDGDVAYAQYASDSPGKFRGEWLPTA